MAAPKLHEGETVLFTARPGSWMVAGLYFWTLGLYHFWRRATYYTVTDQRVIKAHGKISKSQRNFPLEMLQDASLKTAFGSGSVVLSSAGGTLSLERLGPMAATTARKMTDVILTARERVRQTVVSDAASAAPVARATTADELVKFAGLRDSGAVTEEEFAAQKARLLARDAQRHPSR